MITVAGLAVISQIFSIFHLKYLTMGWLTGGLGLSLLLAICSVHHWEVTPVNSHKEDILEYDVNSIMEMATSYLGKDGVEQIINGDFSILISTY